MPASEYLPIPPEDPTGLLFRYDASDPDCIAPAADGASLSAINDLSGNGHHFTIHNDVRYRHNRPGPGGRTFEIMAGAWIDCLNVFAGTQVFLEAVWRINGPGQGPGDGSANALYYRNMRSSPKQGTELLPYAELYNELTPFSRSDGFHHHSADFGTGFAPPETSGTSLNHATWDGQVTINTPFGPNAPANGAKLSINDNGTRLEIVELIGRSYKPTIVERIRRHAGLALKHGTNFPDGGLTLIWGNSTASVNGGLARPLAAQIWQKNTYLVNMARPYGNSLTLEAQEAESDEIFGFFGGIDKKRAAVLFTGHNDPGTPAINRLQVPWYQQKRASGVKIFLMAPTYRNDLPAEPFDQLIAWERDNHAALFDGFYDTSLLLSPTANPERFPDGTHPDEPGEVMMATAIAPGFSALYDDPPEPLAAGTISFGTPGQTTVAVSVTGTAGGVEPYSHQFRRAPDNSNSPGTWQDVGTASASTTFNASGLTPGTPYWFLAVTTDDDGTSVTTAAAKVITAAATATGYTLQGPASGTVGVASASFTITPNAPFSGTISVAISGGGLSTTIVKTFTSSAAPQTFAITPASAGSITLAPSNSGGLPNPSALSYAAAAVPGGGDGGGGDIDFDLIRDACAAAIAATPVRLDLDQELDDTKAGTTGGALNGAWGTAWGKVTRDRLNRFLKQWGVGPLPKVFALDNADAPTTKVPQ